MSLKIPNYLFIDKTPMMLNNYENLTTSEYISMFIHLLGLEFYTGDICVDGHVKAIWVNCRNRRSIIGDKGYSRDIFEVKFVDEDGSKLSYRDYTLKYYPEYRYIVDEQIKLFQTLN